jgi:hypothetical protein
MKSIFQTFREKRIMQSILYRFEMDVIEWRNIHSSHCYPARQKAYHEVIDLMGTDWLDTNVSTFKQWLDDIEARVIRGESEISPNGMIIQSLPLDASVPTNEIIKSHKKLIAKKGISKK